MSGKPACVTYEETLSTRVAGFLLSKGFYLADKDGRALKSEGKLGSPCSFGILYDDPEVFRLFGLINPRRIFLGVIWFGLTDYSKDKNWVFRAYGRKYISVIKQLAEGMASALDVKITIELQEENPCFEYHWLD